MPEQRTDFQRQRWPIFIGDRQRGFVFQDILKLSDKGSIRAVRQELARLQESVWQTQLQNTKRFVLDDLAEPFAAVVRPRWFTIAIYTPYDHDSAQDNADFDFSDFDHDAEKGGRSISLADLQGRVIEAFRRSGYRFSEHAIGLSDGSYGAILFAETPEPTTREGMFNAILDGFKDQMGETIGKGIAAGVTILIAGMIGVSVGEAGTKHPNEQSAKTTEVLIIKCPEGQEIDLSVRLIGVPTAADLKAAMGRCQTVGRFDIAADEKSPK